MALSKDSIRSCPFCGSRASIRVGEHDHLDVYVECDGCGATGGLVNDSCGEDDFETLRLNKEVAVENWNKRVPQ